MHRKYPLRKCEGNSTTFVYKRGHGQVISTLLKDKVKEMARTSKSVELDLPTNTGKSLRISINPPKNKQRLSVSFALSANDMQKMQTNFNFSQRTTLGVAAMIRSANRNRKFIESNLKEKLSASLHTVDEFFDVKCFDFTIVEAQSVSDVKKQVVYCKNLDGLIKFVKEKRQVSRVHLKVGIDGGGGFLKLCLSIQSTKDEVTKDKFR